YLRQYEETNLTRGEAQVRGGQQQPWRLTGGTVDDHARHDGSYCAQADQTPRLDAQAGQPVVRRDERCHPGEIARQHIPSRCQGIPPSSPFRLCTLPPAVHSPRLTPSSPQNIATTT